MLARQIYDWLYAMVALKVSNKNNVAYFDYCTQRSIGSRALSFSDPYFHFTCLSVLVCVCVCVSFCLSATSELNISETRPDSWTVTMDGLYKLAYGLSIGHTPDDVT